MAYTDVGTQLRTLVTVLAAVQDGSICLQPLFETEEVFMCCNIVWGVVRAFGRRSRQTGRHQCRACREPQGLPDRTQLLTLMPRAYVSPMTLHKIKLKLKQSLDIM